MAPKAPRYSKDLLSVPGMAFDPTIADPKDRIQAYIDSYRNAAPVDPPAFEEIFMRDHVKVVQAQLTRSGATSVYETKAHPAFASRMGNMQGGAVAMILDMCTTMAAAPLARKDFWWFGGVSRTLSITYLRPVRPGLDLVIDCEVLQQGARLSTIRGVMKNKQNGDVLAVAEHNKASIQFVEPPTAKL